MKIGYEEEINKITQKLFNKDFDSVRWVMLTNYVHRQLIDSEQCLRTGLYSWLPVMNGHVRQFQEMDPSEYNDYDIIQVNLSGQDVHILGDIKTALPKGSKTLVVANNDYTVELWQSSFDYMTTYARELQYADMLFGTEPNQCGTLEVLSKRKVHLVVHPCFVKRLKSLPVNPNPDRLSVVCHRYDSYTGAPSLAIKGLGYKTYLIGYDPSSDRKKFLTSCNYNYILPGTNYSDFCGQLQASKIIVDLFSITSQSRTGWDCAALGVPMVPSDRCYSSQVCYPMTMVPPFDIKAARNMVKKLLVDDKFRQEVVDYAKKAVEMVNYDNSRRNYFRALEAGSPVVEI